MASNRTSLINERLKASCNFYNLTTRVYLYKEELLKLYLRNFVSYTRARQIKGTIETAMRIGMK